MKNITKEKPLQIGILDYGNLSGFGTSMNKEVRALRKAIREEGHVPVTYKVLKTQMFFSGKKFEILYNNKKIRGCDVLIPRVAVTNNIDLEVSIIKQFQLTNIPVLNGYLPVQRAKNKLRTMQILTRRGIPVPKTIALRRLESIDDAIKRVGGYPVILKKAYGSYGAGVVIVESRRSLYSALDAIWIGSRNNIILIQEYVSEARGSDYRAFVVGNRVVASMKRQAKEGEFRANLYLGGEASNVNLTAEEKRISIRATKALGLHIGGVDILRSKDGPVIMEVNANPGFKGLEEITGVDVAQEVVKYAAEFAKKNKAKKAKKKNKS